MKHVKKAIVRVLHAIGYDIRRIQKEEGDDLPLYSRIYGREAVEKRRFYNVGAGGFRHSAWTNIDKKSEWYAKSQGSSVGIDLDLMSLTPIPVEDDSAEIVYSSHTIEHITDEAAQNMFNESHRMLRIGGLLRLTTPNIDLDFQAYRANDRHYYYWIDTYSKPEACQRVKLNTPLNRASIQQIFLSHFASSASTLHSDGSPERISDEELDRVFQEMKYEEALNYCISKCSLETQQRYPGNHINWWNKDKLFDMLRTAGFKNIYLSGYGQSLSPVLRNTKKFDNTHPKISLYMEAVK